MQLTAKNVEKVFLDCFLKEGYTDETKVIPVNSVTGNFGFDPDKIEKYSEDIRDMIGQLSSNFDEKNQGYSFIYLPFK